MGKSKIKKVLIIGSSGGLAKIFAGLLNKSDPELEIIGVDSRDGQINLPLKNIQYLKIRYTRGEFERIFREHEFDVVFHLGRISHAQSGTRGDIAERLDLNIMGTSRILELCLKHAIKRVVILSTHHVYGALSDNPVYIKEDSHLRASIKYPELRDVTEMDQLCTNWMWRYHGKIESIVLRPCNIIGPQINNTITQYLQSPLAPVGNDFDPMFQFIHEFDMASILVECLKNIPSGIYNVAPSDCISLYDAKRIVLGREPALFPIFLLQAAAKLIKKLWSFPDYLIEYIKFSCIIDNSALIKVLPKNFFRFTTREALELLRIK